MASNYERTHGLSTITTATISIDVDAHVGMPIILNRAAGCVATLPAATGSGNTYNFIGAIDATGDQKIQVTGNDTMAGVAFLGNDSAGASLTPSPVIATTSFDFCKACTILIF